MPAKLCSTNAQVRACGACHQRQDHGSDFRSIAAGGVISDSNTGRGEAPSSDSTGVDYTQQAHDDGEFECQLCDTAACSHFRPVAVRRTLGEEQPLAR